ncbi:cytosolic protein [Oceanobacillus jeddahense]|uniref:Cytosolic protein n=1 Tax=Oceanobacillus jeddahense TaxID=1462527 RepID=A0ABY5K1M7_9BACI|nr:cytosolic protein [Oceanobacillus jeddahense]UUI05258.1 cytosolic protein [Oceanobacillus jeddahense]
MSAGYKIKRFFSNHEETSDNHVHSDLKTRYYKASKNAVIQELENYFNASPDFSIHARSEQHGEISATSKRGKKVFIIATVIMVRPYQTALDFSVTTETPIQIDFGYSNRIIKRIYQHVNEQLPEIKGK